MATLLDEARRTERVHNIAADLAERWIAASAEPTGIDRKEVGKRIRKMYEDCKNTHNSVVREYGIAKYMFLLAAEEIDRLQQLQGEHIGPR